MKIYVVYHIDTDHCTYSCNVPCAFYTTEELAMEHVTVKNDSRQYSDEHYDYMEVDCSDELNLKELFW